MALPEHHNFILRQRAGDRVGINRRSPSSARTASVIRVPGIVMVLDFSSSICSFS
jgi:hypothetical protein